MTAGKSMGITPPTLLPDPVSARIESCAGSFVGGSARVSRTRARPTSEQFVRWTEIQEANPLLRPHSFDPNLHRPSRR